jgi:hypothetical protein
MLATVLQQYTLRVVSPPGGGGVRYPRTLNSVQEVTEVSKRRITGQATGLCCKVSKVKLFSSRPCRAIGMCYVKEPTYSRQAAHKWR